MNPVDHPMGGGEENILEVYQGLRMVFLKGYKTRKKKKSSDKYIIERRKKK